MTALTTVTESSASGRSGVEACFLVLGLLIMASTFGPHEVSEEARRDQNVSVNVTMRRRIVITKSIDQNTLHKGRHNNVSRWRKDVACVQWQSTAQ